MNAKGITVSLLVAAVAGAIAFGLAAQENGDPPIRAGVRVVVTVEGEQVAFGTFRGFHEDWVVLDHPDGGVVMVARQRVLIIRESAPVGVPAIRHGWDRP